MKTFYILTILLCFSSYSNAQVKKDSSNTDEAPLVIAAEDEIDNKVFTRVEVEAQFPGGDDGWRKYLIANIDPNTPIKHRARKGKYQVVIRFIVDKEGVLSSVSAETSFGHGMEEEAIRVIKNGPKWEPAMQNGKKVNAYRRQPITFVVE